MRTCSETVCINSGLHDNGSCSDHWHHHCCNPDTVEVVDALCDGFSYKISRVLSCACKPCSYKTVVNGRAFGRKDGSEIPLQLGQIIIQGQEDLYTSMDGVFKFEVKKGLKEVVATFTDNLFEQLVDTVKTIPINSGRSTFVTIIMPLRTPPVPFNSSNGTVIHLGDSHDLPSVAKLEFPSDALTTEGGKPYDGEVQTYLQFMDPRRRDDIEASNGEFSSLNADGITIPLKTFGIVQFGVTDNEGNQLTVNKPIKIAIDSSRLNVPTNDGGSSALSVWVLDVNKGTWIEINKMNKDEPSDQWSRPVSNSSEMFSTIFHPQNVPMLDQYKTESGQRLVGYRTIYRYSHNMDVPIPIYRPVTRRVIKSGACFVAVSLYKDLTLSNSYSTSDIEITAYVQELDKSSYIGKETVKMLRNGRACVPIFCDKLVYLSVKRNGNENLYAGAHYLPLKSYVKDTSVGNEVVFESRDYGTALTMFNNTAGIKPGTLFVGPVFQQEDASVCNSLKTSDNSFQFKFAPFTAAPSHSYTAGRGVYDTKDSWYPVSPVTSTFRSCFIKVAIKVSYNINNFYEKTYLPSKRYTLCGRYRFQ